MVRLCTMTAMNAEERVAGGLAEAEIWDIFGFQPFQRGAAGG